MGMGTTGFGEWRMTNGEYCCATFPNSARVCVYVSLSQAAHPVLVCFHPNQCCWSCCQEIDTYARLPDTTFTPLLF